MDSTMLQPIIAKAIVSSHIQYSKVTKSTRAKHTRKVCILLVQPQRSQGQCVLVRPQQSSGAGFHRLHG